MLVILRFILITLIVLSVSMGVWLGRLSTVNVREKKNVTSDLKECNDENIIS